MKISKPKDKKTKEEQEAKLKEADKEKKRLKTAINNVASTESGEYLLRTLRDICGFESSIIVLNPTTKEVCANSSFHDEGRRSVYLYVRKFLNGEALAKIETGDK